jgi:hypothetical protein
MPFDRICQYFKMTQQYAKLIEWFRTQKTRFLQEFTPNERDMRHTEYLEQRLNTPNNNNNSHRNSNMLTTFIQSRNRSLARRYMDDEGVEELFDDPRIGQLMGFFRNMMQVMAEDNVMQDDGASYTASNISSYRYTSVAPVTGAVSGATGAVSNKISSTIANSLAETDFTKPYQCFNRFNRSCKNHNSVAVECTICFETAVPFVLMRKHLITTDMGMSDLKMHGVEYFYNGPVCCKCADYFCHEQLDPVRVKCFAAVPIVNLINDECKTKYLECFAKLTDYKKTAQPSTFDTFNSFGQMTNTFFNMIGMANPSHKPDQETDNLILVLVQLVEVFRKIFANELTSVTPSVPTMITALNKFEQNLITKKN